MLVIIGGVSCADACLNMRYPVVAATEENPVAQSILGVSNNNLALLIALKAAGTILALGFLKVYYYYNHRVAIPVATGLASIQVVFLIYMIS